VAWLKFGFHRKLAPVKLSLLLHTCPFVTQGLSRTPLQLLRLPQLAWYLLRLQLADTPRQRQRLWSEQQTLLGYVLPLHTLVLLLGLVFCVASPLIAPVTLLYFISSSVTQRYQWIYIYRHPYEGAGTLWRQVFNQVRHSTAQHSRGGAPWDLILQVLWSRHSFAGAQLLR